MQDTMADLPKACEFIAIAKGSAGASYAWEEVSQEGRQLRGDKEFRV
jgi:hypothetical protein